MRRLAAVFVWSVCLFICLLVTTVSPTNEENISKSRVWGKISEVRNFISL